MDKCQSSVYRPGQDSVPPVHFTGEEGEGVTGRRAPGPAPLHAAPPAVGDPGLRREDTAGPAGGALPRLLTPPPGTPAGADRSLLSPFWTLPHWSASPPKKEFIFPKEFGFVLV
ncbi:unnamed protein product [Pipistrellus nathusii]|uniref:Uncharacterized protein n=1 Tax=Pipistrellus nathusii TaxID=59473 RepID=A0ABN9Z8E6_PIPNA